MPQAQECMDEAAQRVQSVNGETFQRFENKLQTLKMISKAHREPLDEGQNWSNVLPLTCSSYEQSISILSKMTIFGGSRTLSKVIAVSKCSCGEKASPLLVA